MEDKEEKEEKKVEEVKEEKKEEKKEEEPNWRELLKDDNYFSQEVPYNFEQISQKLKKASENPEKLNPFYVLSSINDFTKFFKEISSALSMGFSDITEKCGIMREKFKEYPEAKDIQDLLQIEMGKNLHKLNRDNNSELGHGYDEYKNYISACRTFLRLLWFMEYLIDIFETVLKNKGDAAIKNILGDSYSKVLAPHHSFFVRKAVGFALMFSSGGTVEKNVKLIFNQKEYNDEAKKVIQNTIDIMKIIWKAGHDFYQKHDLLELK